MPELVVMHIHLPFIHLTHHHLPHHSRIRLPHKNHSSHLNIITCRSSAIDSAHLYMTTCIHVTCTTSPVFKSPIDSVYLHVTTCHITAKLVYLRRRTIRIWRFSLPETSSSLCSSHIEITTCTLISPARHRVTLKTNPTEYPENAGTSFHRWIWRTQVSVMSLSVDEMTRGLGFV